MQFRRVRECTDRLIEICEETGTPVYILIAISRTVRSLAKVLEHMVDTVNNRTTIIEAE